MSHEPDSPKATANLERRIIAAIEAAGGETTKTRIRDALHMRIRTERFNAILEGLVSRGLIELRQGRGTWVNPGSSPFNRSHSYAVTLYRLRKEPE